MILSGIWHKMHRIYEYLEVILYILKFIVESICTILILLSLTCSIFTIVYLLSRDYDWVPMLIIISIPGYFMIILGGLHWIMTIINQIRNDYQDILGELVTTH